MDRASRTVAVATKGGPWQGSDGIITEGSNTSSNDDGVGFKGIYRFPLLHSTSISSTSIAILIRALAVVYEKSDNNALKTLVHSYGDVQVCFELYLSLPCQLTMASVQRTPGPRGQRFYLFRQLAWSPTGIHNLGTASSHRCYDE